MKKVSIFVIVYNQPEYVKKALDSIPARDDIEVIVCDDCSTDNTYEVLKAYNRIPITVVRNEINRGGGYSTNVCLDLCKGEFLFGLDSDDTIITDNFNFVIDNCLDKNYDFIRIKRTENDGKVYNKGYAFHTYFMNSKALNDLRCPDCRWAYDYFLYQDIVATGHNKEKFTDVLAYNYNFPRVDSVTDSHKKGKI